MSDDVQFDADDFTMGIADSIKAFLLTIREVAQSKDRDAESFLLLQLSQLLLAGGRLGALADVGRAEQFEPDSGYDPDLDDIRRSLADLLGPVDEYTEVFDPYAVEPELVPSRLSDDLASIVADLAHGLSHYRAGREAEALWWWQHSYVSNWGQLASACLRALQSVVLHDRLGTRPVDQLLESEDLLLAAEAAEAVQIRG